MKGLGLKLVSASYKEAFTYDVTGNRSSRTLGAVTDDYDYIANTNILNEITDGAAIAFDYDELGRLTMMTTVGDGVTAVFGAAYMPQGFPYASGSYDQDGNTITAGDTVLYLFMPSGERFGKGNLSTSEYKSYLYDLAGNLITEGMYTESEDSDPIIEHICLGNRLIASVTGAGDACFIATVAYETPLSGDLDVFRAFRDRVLKRYGWGHLLVEAYYEHGPKGANWLKGHSIAKTATYYALVVLAVPLKALMFGHWSIWIIIFALCLGVFVVGKKLGWKRTTALVTSFAVAFMFVIVYSFLIEVPKAMADYQEGDKYYYTLDHIGRPLNLRDESRALRWYEQHYPFGEIINEDGTPGYPPEDEITAGAGDYTISWQPHFRFPGQFDDIDQGPFVQNHFREYMPELGRYNRVDPVLSYPLNIYGYAVNDPYKYYDFKGRFADKIFWFAVFAAGAYAVCYYFGPCNPNPPPTPPTPPGRNNPGNDPNNPCPPPPQPGDVVCFPGQHCVPPRDVNLIQQDCCPFASGNDCEVCCRDDSWSCHGVRCHLEGGTSFRIDCNNCCCQSHRPVNSP